MLVAHDTATHLPWPLSHPPTHACIQPRRPTRNQLAIIIHAAMLGLARTVCLLGCFPPGMVPKPGNCPPATPLQTTSAYRGQTAGPGERRTWCGGPACHPWRPALSTESCTGRQGGMPTREGGPAAGVTATPLQGTGGGGRRCPAGSPGLVPSTTGGSGGHTNSQTTGKT